MVKRVSDTQMEILQGGGCLSVFGLPFLLAGLFMLLLAGGIIPLHESTDFGEWGGLILSIVGTVFTVVGGLLVFGRSRLIFDIAGGVVRRHRGLMFLPIQSRSFPLASFEAVVLEFEEGDSESPDSYPVRLRHQDKKADLHILSNPDYPASLEQSRQLAIFLKLPLEDATTDHKTVLAPEEVNLSLSERLRNAKDDIRAERPIAMQCKVDTTAAGLRMTIPGGGFRILMFAPVVILVAILSLVLPDLMDFFQASRTPDYVQWLLIGFILLMFGLIPVLLSARSIAGRLLGYTDILVADGRIGITEHRVWRRKVFSIRIEDINGLDYGTQAEMKIMNSGQNVKALSSSYVPLPPKAFPMKTFSLMSLKKSKGVTIKHQRGLYTFGAGLPDDEVIYLYGLVCQALAGKFSG